MEMLETYIKQIQRYPLLTAEQEIVLSKQIEKGCTKAKTELINSNLRLVISVVKKFVNTPKVSVMDLIQEGNLGLMAAASKFHYGFKTRFSTYAYNWILQYMLRYLYNKTSMIALPHRKEELLRKITTAKNEYKQSLNREPTTAELAECCGIAPEEVESVLSYSFNVSSIDIAVTDDGSATIADLIADNSYNPEHIFIREQDKKEIKEMVNTLSANERKVIYSRFNFENDLHIPTLRELSSLLGVSAETVRQMEKRAVQKIKNQAFAMNVNQHSKHFACV